MVSRKSKILKDRMKDLKAARLLVKGNVDDIDTKIARITSYIKNTELDLQGKFIGNFAIINKINVLKEYKLALEKEKEILQSKELEVAE